MWLLFLYINLLEKRNETSWFINVTELFIQVIKSTKSFAKLIKQKGRSDMPTVIINWLNNLIGNNPNKNGLNLIGLLMAQVRAFQVTPVDEQSVIGQWLLNSQANLNQSIAYLTANADRDEEDNAHAKS